MNKQRLVVFETIFTKVQESAFMGREHHSVEITGESISGPAREGPLRDRFVLSRNVLDDSVCNH